VPWPVRATHICLLRLPGFAWLVRQVQGPHGTSIVGLTVVESSSYVTLVELRVAKNERIDYGEGCEPDRGQHQTADAIARTAERVLAAGRSVRR